MNIGLSGCLKEETEGVGDIIFPPDVKVMSENVTVWEKLTQRLMGTKIYELFPLGCIEDYVR